MMQNSNLSLRKWALSIYLVANSKKGLSYYKLVALIGVTQKTA